MGVRSSPIFENRVFVEPESLGDYEAWVTERAGRARHTAGIVSIDHFETSPDEQGWPGRAVQFTAEDDEALVGDLGQDATIHHVDSARAHPCRLVAGGAMVVARHHRHRRRLEHRRRRCARCSGCPNGRGIV